MNARNGRTSSFVLTFCLCALELAAATKPGDELFTGSSVPLLEIHLRDPEFRVLSESNRNYVKGVFKSGTQVLTDIGIRLKGRSTYQPLDRKPSFTIKFNQFTNQTYSGLTKIMLNNSVGDPSYLREYLSNQLFRDAGVPAPRVAHARVRLNGRDLGLYVVVEGINKAFLDQYFSRNDGNLYEGAFQDINQNLEQDGGADRDHAALRSLCTSANVSDPEERWRSLAQVIDIDRFMRFLAMEQITGQQDGYATHANSYRIYHDPGSHRMVLFPHGLDRTFIDTHFMVRLSTATVLVRAALRTHEGRRVYRQTLESLSTEVLKVRELTNRAANAIVRLRAATTTPEESSQIDSNYLALCKIIVQRASNIAAQIKIADLRPLEFDAQGIAMLSDWKASATSHVQVVQRVVDEKPFLHIRSSQPVDGGAFRTRVLLEPGKYMFRGQVRLSDVEPAKAPQPASVLHSLNGGVLFQVVGKSRTEFLTGSSDWKDITREFEVDYGPLEMEFACELRFSKGDAWFRAACLQRIQK